MKFRKCSLKVGKLPCEAASNFNMDMISDNFAFDPMMVSGYFQLLITH